MFIDTHCHLTEKYLNDDLDAIITRANDAGVDTIICPTADPNDINGAISIANTHQHIFLTLGIHPEYAGTDASKFLTDDILSNPRVVGIGEIGLDYHSGNDDRMAQIELFRQQLEIAHKHNLPVAIHTRDAESDTDEILHGDVRGVGFSTQNAGSRILFFCIWYFDIQKCGRCSRNICPYTKRQNCY